MYHLRDRGNRYLAAVRGSDSGRGREAEAEARRGFVRRLQHTKNSFSIWLWNNEQRLPPKA